MLTYEIENDINNSHLIINDGTGVNFLSFARFNNWFGLDDVDWEMISSNRLINRDDYKYVRDNYICLNVSKNYIGSDRNHYFWAGYLFDKNKHIDVFVGETVSTLIDEVFSEYPYLFVDTVSITDICNAKLNILNEYKDSDIVIVDESCELVNVPDKNYKNICFVGEYTTVGRLLKSVCEEEHKLFFRVKSKNFNDDLFDIVVLNDNEDPRYNIEDVKLIDLMKTINGVINK